MAINTLSSNSLYVKKLNETSDVDLSSANVTGTGLDYIASLGFSAASTFSMNSVFSDAYVKYQIHLDIVPDTNTTLQMRMRLGEVDTTTTLYAYRGTVNGTDGGGTSRHSAAASSVEIATNSMAATRKTSFIIDVTDPYFAEPTIAVWHGFVSWSSTSTSIYYSAGSMNLVDSIQYDGITFYPAAGTFTGTAKIFGYHL